MDSQKRILGCLVAGAIGDCLGGPYETHKRVEYVVPYSWKISDDTQLTLATCHSLAAERAVHPERIAKTFADWYRRGRLSGMGASTLKAIREITAGGHWALVGRKGDRAAGNGAAMRIAPLAFLLDPADEKDRQQIRDVCRITHHNDEAYAGALAIVAVVHGIYSGKLSGRDNWLNYAAGFLPDTIVRDRLLEIAPLLNKSSVSSIADRYGCSGYVAESVPLAIFAAAGIAEKPLPDILEALIRCGGDTDSNAAIAGNLMGTYLGFTGIPYAFRNKLELPAEMQTALNGFAEFVSAVEMPVA